MYQPTDKQRDAIEKLKAERYQRYLQLSGWRYSYSDNPILSGNGHQRYAHYVEWCRQMRMPAAPIGTWAAINDKIMG